MDTKQWFASLAAVACMALCFPGSAQQDTPMMDRDACNGGAPFQAWSFEQQYAFAQELPTQILTHHQEADYETGNRLDQLTVPARGGEIVLLYDARTTESTPQELLREFLRDFPEEMDQWTYQEKALYGDKLRELMSLYPGFNENGPYSLYGLPEEDEVSFDEALAFAREVVMTYFGQDEACMDEQLTLWYAEFIPCDSIALVGTGPEWNIVFGPGKLTYQVYVYAGPEGPQLITVNSAKGANG